MPTWPTPALTNGTTVEDDHWNIHVDNLNELDSRTDVLEARTTNATTGNTALGTRVTTVETRTTDASSGNVALGNRLGSGVGSTSDATTGTASAQLAALRGRATNLEGMATGLDTDVTALETAVGMPWTGGNIKTRLATLEGGSGASGWWKAANSTQTIAYADNGSLTNLLFGSAVQAAAGLTTSVVAGGTVVTIGAGQAGWYGLSAQFDVVVPFPSGNTWTKCVLGLTNSAGTIQYGTDNELFLAGGWSAFNAMAEVYLNVGDTVKATLSIHTGTAITGTTTNAGPGTDRTHLKVVRLRS